MTMLPEFLHDTTCIHGHVPVVLEHATVRGVLWQAASGRFQLDCPGVARYRVEHGRTVTIDSATEDADKVARIFRMTPLAALLYQRGKLALHAAAVTNGSGCLLLAGESGTGKSALLAALLHRGWFMLGDDLAAITLDDQGCPVVCPTFPEIALWPDNLQKLGIAADAMPRADANRLLLRPEHFVAMPMKLRGICWLVVHGKDAFSVTELTGGDRFKAIATLSYNSHVADALLDRVAFLHCATAVSQSVAVHRFSRPRGQWTVEEQMELISKAFP